MYLFTTRMTTEIHNKIRTRETVSFLSSFIRNVHRLHSVLCHPLLSAFLVLPSVCHTALTYMSTYHMHCQLDSPYEREYMLYLFLGTLLNFIFIYFINNLHF